ncbi:MAG: DUF2075 domain-containing protein [Parcubacteria group bacterium]|jgi:hypothetical protein
MIVYQSTKQGFSQDVVTNNIEVAIYDIFQKKLKRKTTISEMNAWKNSMMYMENILQDEDIPSDCGVMIEYQIPQTSKRVDFILTGQNNDRKDHAVIVELKQWEKAEITEMDGIISTFVGGGMREVSHPAYQAWSYAALLDNFNEAITKEEITLMPCAYLHNYIDDGAIRNEFYAEHIKRAPVFLRKETLKLREFIKKFVKYGDKGKVMFQIESGIIKPSKCLADSLSLMLLGNSEFVMVDDQKVVFEKAKYLALKSTDQSKNVFIVEGGPGTGKSVVAINLMVELIKNGLFAQYVSKNSAPRTVYESKLVGTLKKTEISNLFSGSGSFYNAKKNIFGALIVDEAHRLNSKSGMFKNMGENQIKEIINASKFSVFFIDENQKIHFDDIGEKDEIKKWAKKLGANVFESDLSSQFRCNGSDGYLSWLDNALQVRETANVILDDDDFDFKVMDSPEELRKVIVEKNKANNKARIVAGYCWDWISRRNSKLYDINIPEYDFKMQWNLGSDGNLWIIAKNSVNEAGCIHTCQGLEVDYIGVIVGDDLIVRDGVVLVDPSKRAKTDASIKGYKTLLKKDEALAKEKIRSIIKNTYRTLMTRGMKGCYVYFTDKETKEYFKSLIK